MEIKIPRVIKNWAVGKNVKPARSNFMDNLAGKGRKYAIEENDPYLKEAFDIFKLNFVCLEPIYKIFTGIHYEQGAFTHLHKDFAPENYAHVRCNVLLEKPKSGGMPIIDGKVLDIDVGDMWIVLASLELHGSTPISGPNRIIKSFGGLVPLSQVHKIIKETKHV